MAQTRYIGSSIKRIEDRPLLTGAGRFVDDLRFPDTLEAAFVRSPHAHAAIRGIDVSAARALPGVHAVFTLADLMPLLSQERLPLQFRTAQLPPDITPFVLAKDEVAFVGEAVAVVIADSRYLAEDAAALVQVDYEPLPAVSDCRAALAPGAPLAHRGRTSNRADRVPPGLWRRRRRVRARAASGERQPQAASRRRPLDRGPRRARRLRRATRTG